MILLRIKAKQLSLKNILSFLIISIVLFIPINAFANESSTQPGSVKLDPVVVRINLLSFNAAVGDLEARLEMFLPKSLVDDRYAPKGDIYLIDLSSVASPLFKMPSEQRFSIFDNVMSTKYQVADAGTQFLYPFDVHHAKIVFFSEMVGLAKPAVSQKIPLIYDCSLCFFEGFDINVSQAKDFKKDFVSLDVSIYRAKAIVIFSVLIIFGMWVVGAAVIILTYRILKSNVAPDVAALGFTGGLLFALPAVRSIQPMVPPVGILADYLGFFWVELLTIVALIIMVICWAHRNR